jgi:hypothetical protein
MEGWGLCLFIYIWVSMVREWTQWSVWRVGWVFSCLYIGIVEFW